MEAMRQSWTDERLDDFREHVDQMDQRFERIEAELRMRGTEINEGFRSLHRMTLQIGAGMFGTLLLAILTMLGTQG